MDLTVGEIGGSGAEDEVCGTLDIAVFKEEARIAAGYEECVLIAEQAAVDKLQAVALGVERYGLAELGSVVFDREVAESDVAAIESYLLYSYLDLFL